MREIVINTGPIIALTAGTGSLDVLDALYDRVYLPREVYGELLAGGLGCAEVCGAHASKSVHVLDQSVDLPVYLRTQLDPGEASVVQTALDLRISTVAIDEKIGRRIARVHGLNVTGSVGILVKAAREGAVKDLSDCFRRMRQHGVWIKQEIIEAALSSAREE